MECKMEKGNPYCNCSYGSCDKKGRCCDCLHYHRQNNELPACFFTREQERTYNRSITYFIKNRQEGL